MVSAFELSNDILDNKMIFASLAEVSTSRNANLNIATIY